jgi:hypothetical protein
LGLADFGRGEEVAAELGGGNFGRGARGVVPGLALGAGCGGWGGWFAGVVWLLLFALAMRSGLDAVVFVEDVAMEDCVGVGGPSGG